MTSGMPGAPLKDPTKKMGWPERALVTIAVKEALSELQDEIGIENRSVLIRYALYLLLKNYKKIDLSLLSDETWADLRRIGLV